MKTLISATPNAPIQKSINVEQLNGLAASTGEANTLIDQRTFSWTAFFTIISKTLPLDARLIAVAPKLDKGNVTVQMQVVSRSMDDLSTLVKALTETGTFYDVLPMQTSTNDDNTITATITSVRSCASETPTMLPKSRFVASVA